MSGDDSWIDEMHARYRAQASAFHLDKAEAEKLPMPSWDDLRAGDVIGSESPGTYPIRVMLQYREHDRWITSNGAIYRKDFPGTGERKYCVISLTSQRDFDLGNLAQELAAVTEKRRKAMSQIREVEEMEKLARKRADELRSQLDGFREDEARIRRDLATAAKEQQ